MKIITKLILVSIVFLSMNTLKSNELIQQNRTNKNEEITKPFTNIDIDGAFVVIIKQGEKESFFIEADKKIMPYIKSSVKNNKLKIRLKTGLGSKEIKEIKLHITIKDLESLKLSGFINLEVPKQLNLLNLTLNFSGAVKGKLNSITKSLTCKTSSFSEIELSGKTDKLKINKNDASSVNASKLKAETVKIKSAGFGTISVLAINKLNVTTSGAVKIAYAGNPTITKMDVKGFSTLKRLNK
ncbi:MAG: head GIN domain-containing protein [Polaribacter sp.]